MSRFPITRFFPKRGQLTYLFGLSNTFDGLLDMELDETVCILLYQGGIRMAWTTVAGRMVLDDGCARLEFCNNPRSLAWIGAMVRTHQIALCCVRRDCADGNVWFAKGSRPLTVLALRTNLIMTGAHSIIIRIGSVAQHAS